MSLVAGEEIASICVFVTRGMRNPFEVDSRCKSAELFAVAVPIDTFWAMSVAGQTRWQTSIMRAHVHAMLCSNAGIRSALQPNRLRRRSEHRRLSAQLCLGSRGVDPKAIMIF